MRRLETEFDSYKSILRRLVILEVLLQTIEYVKIRRKDKTTTYFLS